MTASNPELVPLIYRHLKEHGFHTAADELQKLSPQNEAPTSTTLLDIYTAWLKSSKRRKKPATSKPSTSDQKHTTPKKAAQRKNTNKTTKPGSKAGSPNKKSTPTKKKKGDGKSTEKTAKSNKRDPLKEETAGGEDSDSDSSLDVEKWKKLVQEMTDTDVEKLEAFNALATPEPKKQRVRKPRAKPKPKTETPTDGQGPQSEKSDKSIGEVLAMTNTTKKSRPKKVAPVAALEISNKGQNNETPVASVISTSKQSHKKEKRKASDQASLEPKQKKKKQTIQYTGSTNATDADGLIDKNINSGDKMISLTEKKGNTPNLQTEPKNNKKKQTTQNVLGNSTIVDGLIQENNSDNSKDVKTVSLTQIEHKEESQIKTSNLQTEPKKKKKKKADKETTDIDVFVENNTVSTVEDFNGNLPPENLTSSLNISIAESDSTMKVKKKKKKKDKAEDDEDSQQIVSEAKTNSAITEGTCEKIGEEASPNTEVPKKKKKKKDKNKEESEALPQMETSVFGNAVNVEENAEQIVVKKKSKKKKKLLGTEDETPSIEGCEIPEESPDPPSTPQTPDSKKKKHKLDSEKPVKADTMPLTLDSETPRKKKKKASKSKETES